jgi:1-deoxy-D-xylulose-5-phosphate synthase
LIREHRAVVTLEDNALAGGFGSAVLELMAESGIRCPVRRMGLPDSFIKQGPIGRLREEVGLVAETVAAEATAMLSRSGVVSK